MASPKDSGTHIAVCSTSRERGRRRIWNRCRLRLGDSDGNCTMAERHFRGIEWSQGGFAEVIGHDRRLQDRRRFAVPPQVAPLPPAALTDAQVAKIIEALNSRRASQPCPRCGNETFGVVPGIIQFVLQKPGSYALGGPSVPTALSICGNCGFLSPHALGTLGLLNPDGTVNL